MPPISWHLVHFDGGAIGGTATLMNWSQCLLGLVTALFPRLNADQLDQVGHTLPHEGLQSL
jgi:hypothetical protein